MILSKKDYPQGVFVTIVLLAISGASTRALILRPEWLEYSKVAALVITGLAGLIAYFAETHIKEEDEPRKLSLAGFCAIACLLTALWLGAFNLVTEAEAQRRSTTAQIAALRRLVSPLTDQMTATISLSIPADQSNLKQMTKFLDGLKVSNDNVYLPRLSSDRSRDKEFANLAKFTTAYLYFCRKRECIERLAGEDTKNPEILLSGQVEIDPAHRRPGESPGFEVDTGEPDALWMSLNRKTRLYTVRFYNRRVLLREEENGFQNADELAGAVLVVGLGPLLPPDVKFTLSAVTLTRKNGMFLESSKFDATTFQYPGGGSTPLLIGRLGDKWQ